MKLDPAPSKRYGEYLRKVTCDEWEVVGLRGDDKVVLRHRGTAMTIAYGTHDGGNDWNGPRNMALAMQRACGCRLIEPRGRKRSRKGRGPTREDLALAAARRKHRERYEAEAETRGAARAAERAAAQRRAREIAAAADADRRRRDIEDLMRPGRG